MALVSKSVEYYSGFDPRMIPGCVLWLDGTDATTITGTSQVTEWRDKSSNAYAFTRKSSSYPVVSNMPFSDLSGLYIGSNAALANSNITIPSDYTFFAVANRAGSNGGYGYIAKMNTASDFYGFFGVQNEQNSFATFVGTNATWRDVASNVPKKCITELPTLLGCVLSGATLTPYWNGEAMTNKTGTATATTGMTIGDASTATFGQPWLGIIGEVLMFSNALSSNHRQQIEAYLTWKWKLRREDPYTNWATGSNPLTFNPTNVSGIALWLDASDTSTLTFSGSNVTGWTDKSGLGRVVTFRGAVGASNPIYDPMSRSVVTSNNSFTAANVDTRRSTTTYLNVFIVYRWLQGGSNGQTSNVCLWGADGGGGNNRFQLLGFPGALPLMYGLSRAAISPFSAFATGLESTNQIVYSCRYACNVSTGGGMFVRVNGQKATQGTYTEGAPSPQTAQTSIGFGAIDEANSFSGRIAFNEIIVYRADLSDSTRLDIETYLATKWGIKWYTPMTPNHPFYREPISNRPYFPTDNNNIGLWLDAADYASVDFSGTGVLTWKDKSGNRNDATGRLATSNYPTYSNGLIRFDGVTSFLQVTNPSIRPTNSYAVVQSASATGHIMRKGRLGTTDLEYILRYSNSNIEAWYATATPSSNNATWTGGVNSNRTLVEGTWDGTTIRLYTDGTLRASTAFSGTQRTATTECTDLRIGAEFSANSNTSAPTAGTLWNGTICELTLFSNALDIQQRQQIEGYSMWKWGTQANLPTGHAFKNFYPLFAQFTPGQASNLALWLDASDPTTFELSGTTIRRWRDKSQSGLYSFSASQYDASAIGVCSLSNNVFGKLPAVRFTGSNCFVGNTSCTTTGLTVFALCSTDVSFNAADQRIISISLAGNADHNGSNRAAALFFGGSVSNRLHTYRNGTLVGTVAPTPVNQPFVAGAIYSSGSGAVFMDGSQGAINAASTGTFASTLYGIGNQAATITSEYLIGYVGEILMFSNSLTNWERRRIEGYLAWKWGTQDRLPTWHPHKYFSP
jgi:hypothetical protein